MKDRITLYKKYRYIIKRLNHLSTKYSLDYDYDTPCLVLGYLESLFFYKEIDKKGFNYILEKLTDLRIDKFEKK